ncbi:MAG: hypothetical protein LUD77_08635 [Clostridiales bacterium]|nr:hypothetical protein [Clostridiales bacterium]
MTNNENVEIEKIDFKEVVLLSELQTVYDFIKKKAVLDNITAAYRANQKLSFCTEPKVGYAKTFFSREPSDKCRQLKTDTATP